MTTVVRLTGVEALGCHGVFADEKANAQPFVVDVECVVERSSDDDDLATTLDYGALADQVVSLVAGESFDLIETLAGRIARACLARPGVARASVTVHKPRAPLTVKFADVSVSVTLDRRPTGEGAR